MTPARELPAPSRPAQRPPARLTALAAAIGLAVTSAHPAHAAARHPARSTFHSGPDTLSFTELGRGPVVVILAGGPGMDAAYMRPVAQAVARAGFRAVLLDPRGSGASQAAPVTAQTAGPTGASADLEALRLALRQPRIGLLGHSFGGAIAQAYASAHPDRVSRLILMDSVGPSFRQPPAGLDAWRARLTPDQAAAYDRAKAANDRERTIRLKFQASFDDARKGAAFIQALGPGRMASDSAQAIKAAFDAGYDLTGPAPGHFPVAVLAGQDDWIRAYEPALRERYPEGRFRTIVHSGHFPWAEQPAETSAAIAWSLRQR